MSAKKGSKRGLLGEASSNEIGNGKKVKEHIQKKQKNRKSFETKFLDLELFGTYKGIHGHLNVPQNFFIPADKAWPEQYHGFDFGTHVKTLRRELREGVVPFDPDELEHIMQLGFVIDSHRTTDSNILTAFETYKLKFGNVDVPNNFEIEEDALTWPEQTRGIKLGIVLANIRLRNKYAKIRESLVALGADLKPKKRKLNFKEIYDLLLTYKAVHGDVDVPVAFKIPENDEMYPEKTWGFKLGRTVKGIRLEGGLREHREELIALGIAISKN